MWLGARDRLPSFREACISNLSLLLSLEPFEKFVVVGVMGGGWWSRVSLVLSLRLKLNNYATHYTTHYTVVSGAMENRIFMKFET